MLSVTRRRFGSHARRNSKLMHLQFLECIGVQIDPGEIDFVDERVGVDVHDVIIIDEQQLDAVWHIHGPDLDETVVAGVQGLDLDLLLQLVVVLQRLNVVAVDVQPREVLRHESVIEPIQMIFCGTILR